MDSRQNLKGGCLCPSNVRLDKFGIISAVTRPEALKCFDGIRACEMGLVSVVLVLQGCRFVIHRIWTGQGTA